MTKGLIFVFLEVASNRVVFPGDGVGYRSPGSTIFLGDGSISPDSINKVVFPGDGSGNNRAVFPQDGSISSGNSSRAVFPGELGLGSDSLVAGMGNMGSISMGVGAGGLGSVNMGLLSPGASMGGVDMGAMTVTAENEGPVFPEETGVSTAVNTGPYI